MEMLTQFDGDQRCIFCRDNIVDELKFRKIHKYEDVITHYFCMLFSAEIEQNGADTEGILGFLTQDIEKEKKRGDKIHCSYCLRGGATINCSARGCKKKFHYSCGVEMGSLHQFFDHFNEIWKSTIMFACEICDRQFLYKNSVNRHFRREHINKESRRRLKCTECDHECRFYQDLRTHIYDEHGIVCKVERRVFADIEEFKTWKHKFEETSHFMYVKHSSSKISVSSNERKTYFVCHRTGTFQSGSCGKRKLKQQGSNKINASCPSTMEVVESLKDGSVKLVLWKTHAGHSADISRTFLSSSERNWLAARISEGASYQKIMNEIQKMGNKGGRMCFIKSQDIRNMRKNLINSRNRVILSDIKSWVKAAEGLNSSSNSPVLYFKDKNCSDPDQMLPSADIMLVVMTEYQEQVLRDSDREFICVDATHCLESYEYQYMTMFVVDDNKWIPVALCVTSIVSSSSIRCFFRAVKEKIGRIDCSVFLSDVSPPFYDAWCDVMSRPRQNFIHLWYLEKTWKENVLRIKCADSVKNMVFRTLKLLVNETDEKSFEKKLFTFVESLVCDSRWAEFTAYFRNEFAAKARSWARCHWSSTDLGFDSQKELEKLHKKLYDEYHNGVNAQRMKDCLNSLVLISHSCETISRIISNVCFSEGGNMLRYIRNGHKRGIRIRRSAVSELSSTSYKVSSDKVKNETYQIRWLDSRNCDCLSRCHSCHICAHEYSCTCVDYAANFNICEHIHACAILRNKIVIDLSSETDEPLDSFVEEVICEEEIICNVDVSGAETSFEDAASDEEDELVFTNTDGSHMESECSSDCEDSPKAVEAIDGIIRTTDETEVNFEECPTLYYEPFAFVGTNSIDDFDETELKFAQDGLQIVAFEEKDEYDDVLLNDDDSSSLGDTSSVYEDVIAPKGAIIALGFGGDSSDSYIFRRFDDNTIIRHKVDTLFTLGEFDNLVDSNVTLPLSAQIGGFECEDFPRCYGSFSPIDEDSIVLTL